MGLLSRFLSWLADQFKQEQYGVPSVTLTGQPVRSKAERMIADYFTRHNIGYQYEAEAWNNDWWIFKSRISRPDFYLPEYGVFVEYWGLVDAPDWRTRQDYVRTMKWKMAQYYHNHIPFISLYPSNLDNLDYYFRKKFREIKGFELPR